jgi:hypothetical protein
MFEGLMRELRGPEREVAKGVFKSTIPLDKVKIMPFLSPVGTALAPPGCGLIYPILMGKAGFQDAVNNHYHVRPGDILIHELTHVWQGIHGSTWFSYAVNSLYHQAREFLRKGSRRGAYIFKAGEPWNSYGAEQQASIVETWFASGSSAEDALYWYIVNHIWAPNLPHQRKYPK